MGETRRNNLTDNFVLDRIILMKNSFRCRPWQSVYIRLVLTLIRTHLWPRTAFMCFCAFSKVTATISIYIICLFFFLTGIKCPLRGTDWGYICICRFLLVLEIKLCYMSCSCLLASLFLCLGKVSLAKFLCECCGFGLSVSFKCIN